LYSVKFLGKNVAWLFTAGRSGVSVRGVVARIGQVALRGGPP
jgi:hypothetical protein